MIFNEISSFETEYKRFLGITIGETNSGPRVFLLRLTSRESGEMLQVCILTGGCHGTLSEQRHVVRNLYLKGIFKPDRYFLTAGTYVRL